MATKNQTEKKTPQSLAETDQVSGQESPTLEATRYIDQENTLFLWGRAGGRCFRCNKYLLEDEISEKQINANSGVRRIHAIPGSKGHGKGKSGSEVQNESKFMW